MSDLVSATPVRSNLAQMLLQLKELPADVVSDGLHKFQTLEQTPQFLRDVKKEGNDEESREGLVTSSSENVLIIYLLLYYYFD